MSKHFHDIIRPLIYIIVLFISASCGNNGWAEDSNLDIQIHPDTIIHNTSEYIVVIGDIQEYTANDINIKYLNHSLDWIRTQNQYYRNIRCVLQNGDITNTNTLLQWNLANSAFAHLHDSTLLIPCTGNHDYDWQEGNGIIPDRMSTKFNEGLCLPLLDKNILERFEDGRRDNITVPVEICDRTIYVISLEFGPRKEVLNWAKRIVERNSDKEFILMTHEWMTSKGERIKEGSYAEYHFRNHSYTTPEEIWQCLVYPNDNVLCVLCGHNGFCRYLTSENKAGRYVSQILFNLQYQPNGGDGMVQIWEFPKDSDAIYISVYNTHTHSFHPNSETRHTIELIKN